MTRRAGNGVNFAEFRNGTDENNLAEFPLSVLTDKVPNGLKTLEFVDTLKDWASGQIITRRVCITGSDKFGLPTPKDEDVLLALIQLTKIINSFTSPEIYFIKRQLIELLGWQNRGWAYDRIEESLLRWKGVSIFYKSAWRDNARGKWCDTEALGVIDYVKLTDSRRKPTDGDDHRSRIIWNKVLFDSFKSGYLKRLDYQTYRSLERPAARRAYRFLDKRFFHEPTWEFELRSFACEKIGLSRNYDTGQLKQRLQPALGELERIGFIAPVQYRKQRPKVWQIAISKAEVQEAPPQPVAASKLVEELVRRGVSPEGAASLTDAYSESRIRDKLPYFDWLVARKDKRVSESPPGWLRTAICKNFKPSKEFLRSVAALDKPSRPVAANPSKEEQLTNSPQKKAILDFLSRLPMTEAAAGRAGGCQCNSNRGWRLSATGSEKGRPMGGIPAEPFSDLRPRRLISPQLDSDMSDSLPTSPRLRVRGSGECCHNGFHRRATCLSDRADGNPRWAPELQAFEWLDCSLLGTVHKTLS